MLQRFQRIKAVVYPQIGRTNTVNSYRRYGITSDHDRFSLRINTVAPTHEGHTRISGDQISHLSSVTLPSTTIESNQNTIVTGRESQQQQRVSVHKQMPSPQQTQQM